MSAWTGSSVAATPTSSAVVAGLQTYSSGFARAGDGDPVAGREAPRRARAAPTRSAVIAGTLDRSLSGGKRLAVRGSRHGRRRWRTLSPVTSTVRASDRPARRTVPTAGLGPSASRTATTRSTGGRLANSITLDGFLALFALHRPRRCDPRLRLGRRPRHRAPDRELARRQGQRGEDHHRRRRHRAPEPPGRDRSPASSASSWSAPASPSAVANTYDAAWRVPGRGLARPVSSGSSGSRARSDHLRRRRLRDVVVDEPAHGLRRPWS